MQEHSLVHEINKTHCCHPVAYVGSVRDRIRTVQDHLDKGANKTLQSKDVKPNDKQWIASFRSDQILVKFDDRIHITWPNLVWFIHASKIYSEQAHENRDEADPFESSVVMVNAQLQDHERIVDGRIKLSRLKEPLTNSHMTMTVMVVTTVLITMIF